MHHGLGNALAGLGAHIVKVGRAAANNSTKSQHAVVLAGIDKLLADQRHFKGTGNAHQGNVGGIKAVTLQIILRAAHKAVYNKIVEAGGNNGNFQPFGIQLASDGGNSAHGYSLARLFYCPRANAFYSNFLVMGNFFR